jgi:protein-tyrosine phosphatase
MLTCSRESLPLQHTQHIINCTRTFPNCFQSCGLSYLRVGIADEAKEDVSEHFTEAFAVIEEARSKGGACLVHCNKGMSRSAILVLAFLVAHCNLSAVSALQLLQQKRPAVSPNPGFLSQLLKLELKVRGCISLDATKVRAMLLSTVAQRQTAIA